MIFFYFRPKSRPFLEKADFLRKKKTLFALFFQKGLLSRPRSTKVDPVGITGTASVRGRCRLLISKKDAQLFRASFLEVSKRHRPLTDAVPLLMHYPIMLLKT